MENTEMLLRLKKYIDYKGFTIKKFEQEAGISNGALGRALRDGSSLSHKTIDKILRYSRELSTEWLMRGHGNMIKTDLPINLHNGYGDIINGNKGKIYKVSDGETKRHIINEAEVEYSNNNNEVAKLKELLKEKERVINILREQNNSLQETIKTLSGLLKSK